MRPLPSRRRAATSPLAARRSVPAPAPLPLAAPLALGLVLGLAGCSGGDEGVDPSTADWPEAVAPAEADGDVWVVWTAVADTGGEGALEEEVSRLGELGYDAQAWDPQCQEGAGEKLAGLTGYADPVGVGLAFGSEEDAGVFDTRYEGATVMITGGAYTCD